MNSACGLSLPRCVGWPLKALRASASLTLIGLPELFWMLGGFGRCASLQSELVQPSYCLRLLVAFFNRLKSAKIPLSDLQLKAEFSEMKIRRADSAAAKRCV